MTWWLPRTIGVGSAGLWNVGPLWVRVAHGPGVWEVAHHHDVGGEGACEVTVPTADPVHPGATMTRFALSDGDEVAVTPLLPDDTIVVRPEGSLVVPARRTVTLYTVVPIVVRVAIADAVLQDLPSHPMRRTWVGPPTAGGPGHAWGCRPAMDPSALVVAEGLAIAPLEIVNRGGDPVAPSRYPIPLALMRLYAGPRRLWTSAVRLEYADDALPRLDRVGDAAPAEAGDADLIAEPRRGGLGLAERVIGAWFRG